MSTASSGVTSASTTGEGNVAGGPPSSGINTSVVTSISSVSVNPTIPTIGMLSTPLISGGAMISSSFPFFSGLNFGRTKSIPGVLGSMYPNIPPLTSLGSLGATSAPNLPFTNNLTQVCNVKLDRNNYLLWKSTVLPIIRGHRLEGHVLGDEYTHRSPSTNVGLSGSPFKRPQTQEQWNITDQLLMGWLIGSMTESALMEIVGCNSAREIWITLEALFNSQSESRMLEYKSALTRAVKGSKSMHDYLAQ